MFTDIRNMMPESVSKRLIRKYYKAGSPIILAEMENNYVYFLVEGSAEAAVLHCSGAIASVYLYETGGIFGEIEPFYEGVKPVTITALTPCVVDILYKDDFIHWLKEDFEATKVLISLIALKLVRSSERIEEMTILSVRERVLRCVAVYQHKNILNRLTKSLLANETGAPVRSINRAIAQCAEQGLFYYTNGKFHVKDSMALKNHLPDFIK